ncbi:VOC family protein [Tessaracoccus lapidicaptus]|uniref:VOC family protein n=1 Tax=Tessaracoccus lapidicaptus TaxID=1427523 RepID=UPI0033417FDF
MDARVNFITLAVTDVSAARRFYVDGLGWEPAFEAEGIIMIRLAPTLVLSLWDEDQFEAEVGPIARGDGLVPLTLAHNVPAPEDVDGVLADAAAAGARDVVSGQTRDWGGYSGYFADPDGIRWEVAYNPGPLGVELMEAAGLLSSAPAPGDPAT